MGQQISQLNTLANPIFSVPNRGGVVTNDLVTLFEDGTVVKTSTTLSLALENNTTNGPVAVKASAAVTGNNYRNIAYAEQMTWLGNGNYAQVYTGNGTTNSTGVRFRLKNQNGGDVAAEVVVSSAASIGTVRVAKLNSTQFVVAWTESTTLKFAIYDNDGTVVVAATTIATLSGGADETNNMAVTAAGEVVFAYQKVTSTDVAFKRYNAGGVLQGAETTVEAAADGRYIAIKACSGGDFVIFYRRIAATNSYKFARYNSSGVIQGALTSLSSGNSEFTQGKANGSIAELSNGNIVMAATNPANSDASLYIYTSANALVTRIDLASTFNNNSNRPQVVAAANGFAAAGMGSTGTNMMLFDSNGNSISSQVVVDNSAAGNGSGSNLDLYSIGIGYALCRSGTNGTNYTVHLLEVDSALAAKGSVITIEASSTTLSSFLSSAMSPGYLLAFQYTNGATMLVKGGVYKCLRSSIFGIANATAADGITASISTVGGYTVNQSLAAGGAFNQNAATIPGNRGTVAGTSALLFGLAA